jgi:hypothetical protein
MVLRSLRAEHRIKLHFKALRRPHQRYAYRRAVCGWLAYSGQRVFPRSPGAVVPYCDAKYSGNTRIWSRPSGTGTGQHCRGSEAVRSSPAADEDKKLASRRRGFKSPTPNRLPRRNSISITLAPHPVRRSRPRLPGSGANLPSGVAPVIRVIITPPAQNLGPPHKPQDH